MIDLGQVEKLVVFPESEPPYNFIVFSLKPVLEDNQWVWKVKQAVTGWMTKKQLKRSEYKNLPVVNSLGYKSPPMTDFEKAQIFGVEKVDWRPNETIPEDYYAL
jgi:hypothetical protein